MKKFMCILLAFLLCFSVLLTGCSKKTDDDDDKESAKGSKNEVGTDKNLVIDAFAKIEMASFAQKVYDAFAEVDKDQIAFQLDFNMNYGADIFMTAVAFKDGYTYEKSMESSDGERYYSESFNYSSKLYDYYFYSDDGIYWNNYTEERTNDTDNTDVELIFETIKQIEIPTPTKDQLKEKNGLLVLDNAYLVELFKANVPLISELVGEEPTDEELEEAIESIEETINNIGLEIAFGTGKSGITKVVLSVSPTADEMKEVIKSAKLEMALTADGKTLDYIDFSLEQSSEYEEIDYTPKHKVRLKTIINGKEVEGFTVDGELTIPSENYISDTQYILTYTKLDIDAEIYVKGGKDGEISVSAETEDGYFVEGTYGDDYSFTVTNVRKATDKEISESMSDIDVDIDIHNKAEGQYNAQGRMTVMGEVISIEANLCIGSAPNFPKIPKYVTDRIEQMG